MMLLLHWWITRYTAIVVAAAGKNICRDWSTIICEIYNKSASHSSAMMMAGTALVIVVHVRWKKKGISE